MKTFVGNLRNESTGEQIRTLFAAFWQEISAELMKARLARGSKVFVYGEMPAAAERNPSISTEDLKELMAPHHRDSAPARGRPEPRTSPSSFADGDHRGARRIGGREVSGSIRANYTHIAGQIKALERTVLAFQRGIIDEAGQCAAIDSNLAIILSARLANVWRRMGRTVRSSLSISSIGPGPRSAPKRKSP